MTLRPIRAREKDGTRMLKIIKGSEPVSVEQITLCIYSPPGVGKTSLGFTATDALLLDFDSGSYRSKNRGDAVPIKTWGDIATIAADDLAGYKTIVIDT